MPTYLQLGGRAREGTAPPREAPSQGVVQEWNSPAARRAGAIRPKGNAGASGLAPALAYAAFFFEAVFFGTEDALVWVGVFGFFTGFFAALSLAKCSAMSSVRV